MSDLAEFACSLDGELFTPESPGYEAIRRPVNPAYRDVHPKLVVRCRSVSDVVNAISYARTTGARLTPRGGGHCFAGRSSTDGIVLDLSGLNTIVVTSDHVATIGAGARLRQVYEELHTHGRTLPAGCGPTVGITGLTLGGGIGLLGRKYGLTCDRLLGAQLVLADGTIIDCDQDRHADLFWALRGAGGGQFGVVTSLRFSTVPEPTTTRIEAHWSGADLGELVAAWQAWAPDAPDDLTVNLSLRCDAGVPVEATLFGASTLDEAATRELLPEFITSTVELRPKLPYYQLKSSFADAGELPASRSEFFAHSLTDSTLASLLAQLTEPTATGRRELSFTTMGGAYRIPEDATAFAHRNERFLLEHITETDTTWLDNSWTTAHADGSGRVYPNFPDAALADWRTAYHAGNYPRLAAIKNTYDPHRFFDFPQAI